MKFCSWNAINFTFKYLIFKFKIFILNNKNTFLQVIHSFWFLRKSNQDKSVMLRQVPIYSGFCLSAWYHFF